MFRRRTDNSSLKFDFNQAVADARRDYPEETAHTTFIDLSARGARKQVKRWIEKVYKELGASEAEIHKEKTTIRKMASDISKYPNRWGYSNATPGRKLSLIAMETKENKRRGLRYGIRHNLRFTFNHELGHVLIPRDRGSENIADCFAVMRGLQQGVLSKAEIQVLISTRSIGSRLDPDHDTASVLRTLAHMLRNADPASLTPQKVKKEAALYGAPTLSS